MFPAVPEFYATNMLMNTKNHRIYNNKFNLSVVDLSQIELATEEAERHERTMNRDMNKLKEENAALKEQYAAMATRIAELEAQFAQNK